jgi:hypothetical protein
VTDECQSNQGASGERFAIFFAAFVTAFIGGTILFIWLGGRPFGIQIASVVPYSAAVLLYTFSANRNNNPPYMFRCPVVRQQLPRLARRHFAFVLGLLALQTIVLSSRPLLPPSWFKSEGTDMPPMYFALLLLSAALMLTEVLTNRSLLDRAHSEIETDTQTATATVDRNSIL